VVTAVVLFLGVVVLLRPGGDGGEVAARKGGGVKVAARMGDTKAPVAVKEKGPPPAAVIKEDQKAEGWGQEVTNSIGMKLVRIPKGTFTMGSPASEDGHENDEQHAVEITKDFWLGVHEVTQKQYQQVMGKNPSYFSASGGGKDQVAGTSTDDFPVEMVTWDEAVEFCKKLSERAVEKNARRLYRLPTEAEWEYACRGGAPSYQVFHFGNSLSSKQANFNGNYPYGGAGKAEHLARTCKVGSYAQNRFGLHDMHGNVWEWCADWYDKDYYGTSPRRDPQGPSGHIYRVIRGGGWDTNGRYCRSASRDGYWQEVPHRRVGFRVAAVLSEDRKGDGAEVAARKGDTKAPVAVKENGPPRLANVVGEVVRLADCPQGSDRVAFAPDGRHVATAGFDHVIRFWDVMSGALQGAVGGHTERVPYVAFDHDGKRVVSASGDKTVRIWDASTHRELKKLGGHQQPVWCAVFSPDGRQVLTGGNDTIVRLFDANSGNPLKEMKGHTALVNSVAYRPRGKREALSAGWDKTIRIWNLNSGKEEGRLEGPSTFSTVCYVPDGSKAVSGDHAGTVRYWDVDKRQSLGAWKGHEGHVWIVAVSADGRRALSGGSDGRILLWDLARKQIQHTYTGHEKGVTGVAFAPNGKHFASSSLDGTLRVWGLPPVQ
jgi:formylglycine-generating enzyme required for sulfatase activity